MPWDYKSHSTKSGHPATIWRTMPRWYSATGCACRHERRATGCESCWDICSLQTSHSLCWPQIPYYTLRFRLSWSLLYNVPNKITKKNGCVFNTSISFLLVKLINLQAIHTVCHVNTSIRSFLHKVCRLFYCCFISNICRTSTSILELLDGTVISITISTYIR